jgi:hypothetical protein
VFDAPIDRVWEMFHDPRSHVAKFELMGHRDVEILDQQRSEGLLRIEISQVVDVEIPGFAKRFLQPTNTVISNDRWERRPDGSCGGGFEAAARGAPVKVSGTTEARSLGDGTSHYEISFAIAVNVPLVGGRIAAWAEGDARRQLEQEFAAGDEWLAHH